MYRGPWTYLLRLLQTFNKPICCLVSLFTKMDTLMDVKKMKTQDEIETEEEEEEDEERIILPDIAFNILKRLPLNTLMLSRCVCKSWNSTTYDLSFADEFLAHSCVRPNITSVLIFVDNFYRDRFLFYSLDHETQLARPIYHLNQPDFSSAKFTGSVNGLVCFEIGVWTYICNLSNGGMILLPFTRPNFEFRSDAKIRSYSSLGYNLVSRNYKVLKTWEISTPDSFVCRHKVLTLGASVWKTVDSDPLNSEFIEFDWGNSVCVNGAIHCFSFDSIGKMKIMAFVLAKESFAMLSIPDGFSSHDQKAKLVLYKDRLAVIDYGRLELNSLIKLYILDDYKNQVWKEENIILPHRCRYAGEHHGWSLAGSNRKGDILLAPKVAIRDFSFVSYDLEKRHLRKINVRGLPESVFWSPLMVASAPIDYVESVLSLKELYH